MKMSYTDSLSQNLTNLKQILFNNTIYNADSSY